MKAWMDNVLSNSENGIVSSSECMAGAVSELMLFGRPKTDWIGIMDEYLETDGVPMAYSERLVSAFTSSRNGRKARCTPYTLGGG